MSEEIIIDGVNVAGCEHRSDTHNTLLADGKIIKFEDYCHITNDGCYGVNCYYKQLKSLQAENELLKDANAHLKTELKQLYDEPDFKSFRLMGKTIEEWKQLQAENEELKKEIWQLQHRKMWNKEATLQAELLIKENERLKEEIKSINRPIYLPNIEQKVTNKYRKALEEIREMFKSGNNCLKCQTKCENKDILKVISEVLG